MNMPQLRFPEFTDDWKCTNLGRIAKFSKGKGISKSDISENGETECIRYGELYTYYREVIDVVISKTNVRRNNLILTEANDVIIPASGETEIDISTASCVLKSGIALSGDINIIKTMNNGVFLAYYLKNKKRLDIAKLAQGISVIHLYSKQLATLELNIPTIPEQQKIAAFFTTIDQKISQLKRKKTLLEQYKKGVMQKIFSREIRFKDDNGQDYPEWEEKSLNEIAKYRRGSFPQPYGLEKWYDDDYGDPFVQVFDVDENFKLKESTKRKISNEAKEYSVYVKEGSIVLTIQGSIGRIAITQYDAYVDRTLLIFTGYRLQISLKYFICAVYLLFQIEKRKAPGGTLKTITKEVLSDFNIPFPSYKEQEKIGNFILSIDEKINYMQKQIENTEVWKKGLMQQMFV